MTLEELIAQIRASMAPRLTERDQLRQRIADVRTACFNDEQRDPSEAEAQQVREAQASIERIDAELAPQQARVEELTAELERDQAADRLAREVNPTGTGRPAYDRTHRVGQEKRTYRPDEDPKGLRFLQDVAAGFLGDFNARDRLSRHMAEERVDRGEDNRYLSRAVGTGAFSGLVVPQYLTELYAPKARAGRPFADACTPHDLPPSGMVAEISKLTTGTSSDEQANENDAVDETDADDTLLTIPVRTNAGSQTISRQAAERGTGIEPNLLKDMFKAYSSGLDNKLLNRATTGMTNVAAVNTYTSAAPTGLELYPLLLQLASGVEEALLDQDPGDTFIVMRSSRWYWLQAQTSSSWPLFGQPGIAAQLAGVNYGDRYGSGFRGMLPNGTPVVVDNNVVNNLGTNTDQDEIYAVAQSECHLWEDPDAPMLIRAEQPNAKKLGIDLVVYGYYAFTAERLSHAQKLTGTGLVAPSF